MLNKACGKRTIFIAFLRTSAYQLKTSATSTQLIARIKESEKRHKKCLQAITLLTMLCRYETYIRISFLKNFLGI